MTISAISSSLSQLTSVRSTSATSAISAANLNTNTEETDSVNSGSDETKLSKAGQLFSKLQDLETSDPAKAKEVLTKIADSLSTKASDSGDSRLQELADKFKNAADTGDLSGIKPPSGGHGHGPGGPSGAGGPPPGPPPSSSSDDTSNDTDSTSSTASASASSRLSSYRKHDGTSFDQIDSIISNALSGTSTAA